MTTNNMKVLAVAAGAAWLIVAGYGAWTALVDEGDNWKPTYTVFSVALLVAAVATIGLAAQATRGSSRSVLRRVGLGVGGLGALSAIVAWAVPVWMTILGVALVIVAIASGPQVRRAVSLLAAGQLVGIAVLLALLTAEVGRVDEYGDHPAAGGIAMVVTAAMTIAALVALTRAPADRESAPAAAA
jgi:hypothetical protein